jgi:membrane-associated protease RseP (regulator of RpoE activity)
LSSIRPSPYVKGKDCPEKWRDTMTLRMPMLILLSGLGGCVAPTTRLATIEPALIEAEEVRQRELYVSEWDKTQHRLDDASFPLLAAATDLCKDDVSLRIGITLKTVDMYEGVYRVAARSALGIGDGVTIHGVASESPGERAGILEGDELVSVNGSLLPMGMNGVERAMELISSGISGGSVQFTVSRNGIQQQLSVTPERICSYTPVVTMDDFINAFADGENVIFTYSMMRFANGDDLATILAHEIAHNAMDHVEAKKQNSLLGGLLGAVLDVAGGTTSSAFWTEELGGEGASRHSSDFEREADYVGMYILARANKDLEAAPNVWRRMSTINPGAIAYESSHPSSAERFVRLTEAIKEIERKRDLGVALLPEMKEPS